MVGWFGAYRGRKERGKGREGQNLGAAPFVFPFTPCLPIQMRIVSSPVTSLHGDSVCYCVKLGRSVLGRGVEIPFSGRGVCGHNKRQIWVRSFAKTLLLRYLPAYLLTYLLACGLWDFVRWYVLYGG